LIVFLGKTCPGSETVTAFFQKPSPGEYSIVLVTLLQNPLKEGKFL
jgi:hypothetical protein